jgi:hypothetical protein
MESEMFFETMEILLTFYTDYPRKPKFFIKLKPRELTDKNALLVIAYVGG